ncbi:helix-turn-helix domain-containing protein [Nocardia sp. NEAU-G5]|uniref:Helix-turn-helix domain-containing protein n=1 Tax=Nocardia albiluteola TaxID=2842303 RepID=A0ABS6B4T5_9NOCA|nr:helix-turn-helix domain-containing protein [Nocardia albiluteola]MBU3064243.1 helix-turn-helix domain-containing protein [Nocardia albiluteola]
MSVLGADAASVLRVVEYFDRCDESAANADAVIRAAALLAECVAGAAWSSGTTIRYDAAGRLLSGGAAPPPEAIGADPAVWLERAGLAHPLDAVLLERLRHCLRVAARPSAGSLRLDDPALLEVVLSEREPRADRVRAMRLLGIDPARAVRVLAVAGQCTAEAVRIIGERAPVLRSGVIGTTTAVLIGDAGAVRELSDGLNSAVVQAFPSSRLGAAGPWVGMGERAGALAAATSWEQARRALRFASSTWHGRRVIAFDRLGSLDLLADLPVHRLLGTRDVVRVNEFAATEAGAAAVDTLEAFCVFGSLRRTATELHLHHSTVAARIAQVEAALGWDVDNAVDRFTATLVLTVRRIAMSSAELAGGGPTSVGPGAEFSRRAADAPDASDR